jgi:hypothetical protein
MSQSNDQDVTCALAPQGGYCTADLPDTPQCGLNYHFGMLLGVEDFRAEQGFQVGRLRRHQRLSHGVGVVAGYPVSFDATTFELRVGPGYAVDALGRDLTLTAAQCLDLGKWWSAHRGDEAFDGIDETKPFDLDILLCYVACLSQPVPAIADPCSTDTADIAYARICETVQLQLALPRDPPPSGYHLLRLWLGLDEKPATDKDGKLLPDDEWLRQRITDLLAMKSEDQPAARVALAREVWAKAVAAESPATPDAKGNDLCVPLARLKDVQFTQNGEQWQATVGDVMLGIRPLLLSQDLLQALLLNHVSGLETQGLDLAKLFSGS